ncbi:hypothetical protein FRC10_007337 [Ceratobasidium sp. 414]|nr:hypothetical protein FRC10_007337 [Ceratobasidium sp. 414]
MRLDVGFATYPRPLARPPRIDSPVGFAERMGYFRRDAYGGYIPSTPNASREMLPANPPRARSEEIRGAVFTIQTPQPRRPSYPDLPNPFSPRRVAQDASAQPSPNSLAAASSSRSRSSSNSSARSGESNPGFAGVGAGSSPQKSNLRISVPMLLLPPQRQDLVPLSAMLARTPTGSGLLGMDSQQPLQVSTPTASGSARPALPPRQLLQAPQPVITPTSPHLRQAGARPGYNSTHQPSRSHPSLSATVSTMSALESAYGFNPMTPRHDRPKSQFVPNEVARPQSSFLQVPPPTMSPSTRQRLSNVAYPLPLPPLSTYPIKSIALSAQQPPHSNPTESATTRTSAVADAPAPAPSPAPSERSVRERPLSVVSSASAYSTSSASHGPVPPREIFGPPGSALPAEDRTTTQQSNAAPSRRPSKSKNAPTLSRGLSQHGMNSQNRWGGTGNGPTRRSLAAQFRQPQAGSVRRS